jgi:hypothetical protein
VPPATTTYLRYAAFISLPAVEMAEFLSVRNRDGLFGLAATLRFQFTPPNAVPNFYFDFSRSSFRTIRGHARVFLCSLKLSATGTSLVIR